MASDEGALTMKCERNEKLQPSAINCWKIAMMHATMHVTRLWTHTIDSEKWALMGLRKTVDNAQ